MKELNKLLVVGAGGVGCEIIKSLGFTGKKYTIFVVDFDTISLSNLSRQFFYKDDDIGKEKASVLAEVASRMFKNLTITPLCINVFDPQFSLDFVSQFDFVFCGVDNVLARTHVNKLCVYTRTKLIDCASSGRFAQSTVILPFETACYNCSPAVDPVGPKVTCTIRSTPENIEHCGAWAFYLFKDVFGESKVENVYEVENNDKFSVFNQIFVDRIKDLQAMDNLWKSRPKPSTCDLVVQASLEPLKRLAEIWTDEESVAVFLGVLDHLSPTQDFDKDNDYHMAFVTASCNLQARCFHIDKRVSMFDCKGLVSVVEPALATTNSIIGGISVSQFENIMAGKDTYNIWLSRNKLLGPKLTKTNFEKQTTGCPVCNSSPIYNVYFSYEKNITDFTSFINVKECVISHNHTIIYDSDDGGDKIIKELKLPESCVLLVSDYNAEEFVVVLRNSVEEKFELMYKPKKAQIKGESSSSSTDIEIIS